MDQYFADNPKSDDHAFEPGTPYFERVNRVPTENVSTGSRQWLSRVVTLRRGGEQRDADSDRQCDERRDGDQSHTRGFRLEVDVLAVR